MPDVSAIYAALSAFEGRFVDILTQNAVNTFVYTSLGDITRNLKKGIVLDDLHEAGMPNVKKIDKTNVGELKEYLREQSVPFVDSYRADLLNGGRYVNVGQWGAPDNDGVHPYLGYNRKWVPWLDQYNQSQREKISNIIQSGKPKDDIRDDLKKFFSERKNHANTVARTEVGNNAAIIRRDRWVKQGYSKFMWVCSVSTNSPCQVMCSQFCGKVYDVDNLPMNGEKAHAHCVLPDMKVYSPHGFEAATKMLYNGPVIRLNFKSGSVTVTPNHMFLTDRGFACADVIVKGDNIFYSPDVKRASNTTPNENYGIARADDTFRSLSMRPCVISMSVPMSSTYLHGDAAFGDKNIDVIFANGFLRDGFNSSICDHCDSGSLCSRGDSPSTFNTYSPLDKFLFTCLSPSARMMSGSRYSSPVFWGRLRHTDGSSLTPPSNLTTTSDYTIFDGFTGNSSDIGDFEYGFPGVEHSDKLFKSGVCRRNSGFTAIFDSDPIINESPFNQTSVVSSGLGDLIDRFSECVSLDEVISVDVFQYCGHVYDFQTSSSLYICNGYINSNCKCNLVAVKGSDSDITNGSTTNPMETEGYQVATSSDAGKRLLEQGYKPDEKYPSIIKVPPVAGTKPVTTATTADITHAKPVMKSKVDDITKPQGTAHPVKSFSTGKTVKIAGEPIYREELALTSLKKEKVVIFDDAGNLVHSAQGTNTSVDVSKFSNKLTGNIVTHNHPNKDSALDLSDGDLNVAGLYGVKEMRVVCNNKLLTLKRTDGGNITPEDAKDLMKYRYNTRMQRMDDMRREVLSGKMSIDDCGDKQGDWWLSRYESDKGDDNHITHEIVNLMGIMQ